MKFLIAFSFLALAFVITHGLQTKNANHKILFAMSVQKKINIDSITVRADKDALVLEGKGSKQQIQYAEKVARGFMTKYGDRLSSPPKNVRNEIIDKYAKSQIAQKKKPSRQIASIKTKSVR